MSKKTVIRRAAAATSIGLIGLTMAACQANGMAATAGGTPTSAGALTTGALPTGAFPTGGFLTGGFPTGAPTTGAGQVAPSSAVPSASATGSIGSIGSAANSGASVSQGTPACTGGQIHVSTGAGGVGMSHAGIALIFTNTSAQTCSLTGYAGAALTFANGSRWNATRAMDSYLGGDSVDKAPMTVVLKPGAAASDLLSWTVISPEGQSCQGHGSTSLLVTTPGTSDTQALENGENDACAYFSITPVVPGTSASKA